MPGREVRRSGGPGARVPHSYNIFYGPLLAVKAVMESRPRDLALGDSCGCLKYED
jgi:hypothetical protein